MSIVIRRAEHKDAEAINALYLDMRSASDLVAYYDDDQIFIIAEHGNAIVGSVRLCVEEGYWILRTMRVHPDFQKQGIGMKMLHALEEYLRTHNCYCLPYTHLVNFYGAIGFETIEPGEAPVHLHERFKTYCDKQMQVVVMKRLADR